MAEVYVFLDPPAWAGPLGGMYVGVRPGRTDARAMVEKTSALRAHMVQVIDANRVLVERGKVPDGQRFKPSVHEQPRHMWDWETLRPVIQNAGSCRWTSSSACAAAWTSGGAIRFASQHTSIKAVVQ